MANTITGRILVIGDVEEILGKGNSSFKKRTIVLNCTRSNFGQIFENYPSFEFFGKHLDDVSDFKVGDIVTIHFSLKGVKVTTDNGKEKYFNTIAGYKIEKYERKEGGNVNAAAVPNQENTDDLPF